MSFPNIPDITPDINITFEEAINLLITSIAMEEVSLSKLIDAETNKIQCVLNDCKHKDSILNDAIKINKSVDDTIKNMIKLQMLLQFKLENIKEIIPTTSTTTTTSTSTCTTSTCTRTHSSSCSTTHTTTCSTSTCSTTTKDECCCSLSGKGIGFITNRNNVFFGQKAELYAFVSCCDVANKTLRYSIKNENDEMQMFAIGQNIKIQCPCDCKDKIIVYGTGNIEKQIANKPYLYSIDFKLTVWNKAHILELKMEIFSKSEPKLNHDSGIVQVKYVNSDSRLKICFDKSCSPCLLNAQTQHDI